MTFQQWKRSEWAAYWWAVVHSDIRRCRIYLVPPISVNWDWWGDQKAMIIRFSPFEFGVHLSYQVVREYGEKVLKDPYWDIPF